MYQIMESRPKILFLCFYGFLNLLRRYIKEILYLCVRKSSIDAWLTSNRMG